jgi:CRISPR-associated endonuclease/helicase Cas3
MTSETSRSKIEEYWQIVEDVVTARGRSVQRYQFFEEVWKALDKDKRFIIVMAPTGGGKTEAVSTPFLSDLKLGSRRWLSLIHVLPTRSLVNSMRWRYAGAIGALGIKHAVISYEYGQLIGVKPYLDGDIVVTTYDTLLYRFYGVGLKSPHIIGQISKLMNSLVIMDEVQLLQDEYWYAMSLIPYHIAALLNCDIQIILMTATLPSIILEMIEKKIQEVPQIKSLDPTIIYSSSRPARGKISIELRNEKLPCSQDKLVRVIQEHYSGTGSILIIANTVEKASLIYTLLLKAYSENVVQSKPVLIHSRLRQGLRRSIEELLESRRDENFILIATQVIEAGLDLDSTLLLTEISPIDSLIQRIGRCGRRRDGLVIVYTESEGASKVYPELLIEKTRSVITENVDLLSRSPEDISIAQILLDQVFDSKAINSLMKNIDLSHIVGRWIMDYWISEFSIDSWIAHTPPGQLLKLGVELLSYRPRSPEEYDMLLKDMKLKVSVNELEENIVKLTIKDMSDPIIPALLHDINGDNYYILIKLGNHENSDEVKFIPLKILVEKMRRNHLISIIEKKVVKGEVIFLLNPAFYEIVMLNNIKAELGVVKPWKKI